jgi:hypothetical protein
MQLSELTTEELRQECINRRLRATGKRPDLMLRVCMNEAAQVAVAAVSSQQPSDYQPITAEMVHTFPDAVQEETNQSRVTEIAEADDQSVMIEADSSPERVNILQQGAERGEHAWMAQQSAVALAVKYAAAHAITEGCKSGFLLYGGRALNSYIGLRGLQMRSDDFDFKVVSVTRAGWVEQVQLLLDAVNTGLGKPLCDLRWPAELEHMAAFVVARRRKLDLMWMPTMYLRIH